VHKFWNGIQEEYDDLETYEKDVFYYINDDEEASKEYRKKKLEKKLRMWLNRKYK